MASTTSGCCGDISIENLKAQLEKEQEEAGIRHATVAAAAAEDAWTNICQNRGNCKGHLLDHDGKEEDSGARDYDHANYGSFDNNDKIVGDDDYNNTRCEGGGEYNYDNVDDDDEDGDGDNDVNGRVALLTVLISVAVIMITAIMTTIVLLATVKLMNCDVEE